MSTPPPHPGQAPALDQLNPQDATVTPPVAADHAALHRARHGHQVLWAIGGVITGLAVGILGTGAESGPATAATSPPAGAAAAKSAGAAAAKSAGAAASKSAAARPAVTAAGPVLHGTTMAGEGLFVIGRDVRRGIWHTSGAMGGATGECYVALLRGKRASSVITSKVVTGSASITTTSHTRAIRTSGCRTWHRVAGPGPAAASSSSRSDRTHTVRPASLPARVGGLPVP
jgi:hypothetical protein